MNELSIVIPCVSSVSALSEFVDALASHLMGSPSETDVIAVVNESVGSVDAFIRSSKGKYPWLKLEVLVRSGSKRSYGALARFGIAYSTSQYVVLVSPYGSDDIAIINEMLKMIREGYQVVQAVSDSARPKSSFQKLKFDLCRTIYRFLAKAIVGIEIRNSTNTFKIFDRVFIQALGLNQNNHSISMEITLKTLLAKGKLAYVNSKMETVPYNQDFKFLKDGIGYSLLLARGFLHRVGILWF